MFSIVVGLPNFASVVKSSVHAHIVRTGYSGSESTGKLLEGSVALCIKQPKF